jgi:hypothetical protein
MQALMTYVGHLDVYQRSAEIMTMMLRVDASTASIYRVCDHYGQQLDDVLYQPREPVDDPTLTEGDSVVYTEIDGSMIFTDNRWREVKLARLFSSDQIADSIDRDRGQSVIGSEYVAHLGDSEEFLGKFRSLADSYAHLGDRLVFLSDGAVWIKQAIDKHYPQATQILDFYHAVEYLGDYAQSAITDEDKLQQWIAQQKALLLAGRVNCVIATVTRQARTAQPNVKQQAQRLLTYYRANRDRMRYDEYIKRGLYIGSGAIESAHRTVVQRRMKLSGQRWSNTGAENMLNLRVCSLSGNWTLVEQLIAQPTS